LKLCKMKSCCGHSYIAATVKSARVKATVNKIQSAKESSMHATKL